ncbi:MAG TPA: glycoside hydrolase family 25 protein [Firmicutes bacterium]|nr:glycoside hydrolase family 25 protein [Bacillota bacterium]
MTTDIDDVGKEILMSSTKLLHWIFYIAFSVCLTFAALQIGGYAEEAPELKENSWRYSDGEALILDSPQRRLGAENGESEAGDDVDNAWSFDGRNYINGDGEIIRGAYLKGVDVNEFNGEIDWERLKASGIDFVIIRCGYGADREEYDDKYWLRNVSECERLGIPYGVYLYSYAESDEYAASEAEHVLRLLEGRSPQYPVYYDLEDNTVGAKTNEEIARYAQIFCSAVESAGYDAGIYANRYWWEEKLTDTAFENGNRDKWVAEYNGSCGYAGRYSTWQCTNSGRVDGIDSNVDINFIFAANNFSYELSGGILNASMKVNSKDALLFLTKYDGEGDNITDAAAAQAVAEGDIGKFGCIDSSISIPVADINTENIRLLIWRDRESDRLYTENIEPDLISINN